MTLQKRNVGLTKEQVRAQTLQRAHAFISVWAEGHHDERQEAAQFEKSFLDIFGLDFRNAKLEHKLHDADGKIKYVDLFWPGELLIEMKTSGAAAFASGEADNQAFEYVEALPASHELPKVVLVSDFNHIRLFDLREHLSGGKWDHVRPEPIEFSLSELTHEEHFKRLEFLCGREDLFCKGQIEVDKEAAEELGKLYNLLAEKRYNEHDRVLLIMRVMFCLFAEDTHIFEENAFAEYILESIDHGQNVASRLNTLFEALNTPPENRANLPCPWDNGKEEPAHQFPYVDGGLFAEALGISPITNEEAREYIVENCALMDWSKVSPSIFGALFQSIRTREERRQLGEHYTSEENIEKVINPLFLDDLNAEYQAITNDLKGKKREKLKQFQTKLGELQFLDPACGCGNFLIVAYQRLRELEYRVIRDLSTMQAGIHLALDASLVRKVHLSQLHGIEIDTFSAMIALTAAWIADHLANERLSALIGEHIPTIPLTDAAHILQDNALRVEWGTCFKDMEGKKFDYIFGNPPFVGASMMTDEQKDEIVSTLGNVKLSNSIDYVGGWFCKSVDYMNTSNNTRSAFVSTNSIVQGEQACALWKPLFAKSDKLHFDFVWKTFKWNNEASGVAAVHCVIIGLSMSKNINKYIFQNNKVDKVENINEYAMPSKMLFIESRSKPICDTEKIIYGNKPADNGNLILSKEEVDSILRSEPGLKKYIKEYIGSSEFINNKKRYCFWLVDADPVEIRKSEILKRRIERIRRFREASSAKPTRDKALCPQLFFFISQPKGSFLAIPRVSSEKRYYIPIGFMDGNKTVASDALQILPKATLYHFGILTSSVHMVWMRLVAGRLKSDYRYSNSIVYNNFPWPKATDTQKEKIRSLAQKILDARAQYPDSSLADLYDPVSMPTDLLKAHQNLDKAVINLYDRNWKTESDIISGLFKLYAEYSQTTS